MAAGTLQAPGTDYGPCTEPCRHTDCAQTREMATTSCTRCGDPIGYGRHFFRDGDGLIHSLCLAERVQRATA